MKGRRGVSRGGEVSEGEGEVSEGEERCVKGRRGMR